MYNARNNEFIGYKYLTTCILQFTRYEQLVNFRGIQNWWRHDDVIRMNPLAHVHIQVGIRMLNLSICSIFVTCRSD